MKAYSEDLRRKIVDVLKRGTTKNEAAIDECEHKGLVRITRLPGVEAADPHADPAAEALFKEETRKDLLAVLETTGGAADARFLSAYTGRGSDPTRIMEDLRSMQHDGIVRLEERPGRRPFPFFARRSRTIVYNTGGRVARA
jgi:hypothetical protein